MFSIKTRTTIFALVAATALSAGAPVAGAQDNSTTPASSDQCALYKGWYEEELKAAGNAVNKHQPSAVTKAYGEAEYTLRLAASRGCSWATASVVTKAPSVPHGVLISGPAAPGKVLSGR